MSDDVIPEDDAVANNSAASTAVPLLQRLKQTTLPHRSTDPERFKKLSGITLIPRGFLIPIGPVENRWFVEQAQSDLTYHRGENKYNKYAKPPPPFRVYLSGPSHVIVPKFYGMAQFRGKKVPVANGNVDGLPMRKEAVYRADRPLKEERRRPQQSATTQAIEWLQKYGGAMLVMPVGTGKTNCGIFIAVALGRKTLWLTHRSNLMEQAAARCAEFAPGLRIGYLYADVCDVEDKDIVFGMVQSLGEKTYDPAMLRQFGTVVLDEAHHGAAESFVEALWQTAAPRMLALTATPNRKDGLTEVIDHFFSKNRFVVEPLLPDGIVLNVRVIRLKMRSASLDVDMCDSKFRAKQQRTIDALMQTERLSREEAMVRLTADLAQTPDNVSDLGYSALCSALARISSRNALLCAMIKRAMVTRDASLIAAAPSLQQMRDSEFAALHDRERSNVLVSYIDPVTQQRQQAPIDQVDPDVARNSTTQQCERQIIFLTVNVKHVQCMRERLMRSGVPAHMIGMYYGEVSVEEREEALRKRVVLCTYAMAEEGLDVSTANTLIEAAPRGDSSQQTIGRVLRDKMTPHVQPTIVTLVDDWCGMASGMYRKREEQYRKYECALQTATIAATDERANEPGPLRTAETIAAAREEIRKGKKSKKQKTDDDDDDDEDAPKKKSRVSAAERRERSDIRQAAKRTKRSALVAQSAESVATTTSAASTVNGVGQQQRADSTGSDEEDVNNGEDDASEE